MSDAVARRTSLAEQDEFLNSATSNYNYADSAIELDVGGHLFRVSRSRLTLRSAIFQSLFSLPQTAESEPDVPQTVKLESVDGEEFQDYLWYIHADPLCAQRFFGSVSSSDKCSRFLGIANVAHQYDAIEVALWALDEALNLLLTNGGRPFALDVNLARRLLNVATRWQEVEHAKLVLRCRDVVCDALHPNREGPLSRDPIAAVDVARGDTFVLAHVYYYILRKDPGYNWKGDPRLLPIDRRRLLCGSHALGCGREITAAPPPQPPAEPAAPHDVLRSSLSSSSQQQMESMAGASHKIYYTDPATGRGMVRSWGPAIDPEIKKKRNALWDHFDDASWKL